VGRKKGNAMSETLSNQLRFEEIVRCLQGGHVQAALHIAQAAAAECAQVIEEYEEWAEGQAAEEDAYRAMCAAGSVEVFEEVPF
jgi:hypothetical protein